MDKKENKFWVFWGKLSAIAFTLAALVTLYFQVFPSKSSLTVVGASFGQYALPVDVVERLKKIDNKISSDSLENYLSEFEITNKTKLANKTDLLYFFSKKLRNDISYYSIIPNEYRGFLFFRITNDGSKPSEDIYFSLPLNGIALLTEENDKQTVVKFKKEIKIKELRPRQSISIAMWTEYSLARYDEEEIKISDKEGMGSISMSYEVDGFAKFIAKNLFFISFIIIIAFISLILFAWSIYPDTKEKKSSKNIQSDENETEESVNEEAT